MALGVGGTLFAPGGGAAGADVSTPSLGKNSKQQNLSSPHSGQRSTITKGDPMSRSMGQYGKGHSFASPLSMIRGGAGGMKRIRGGLGPGKQGQPGASADYSMTSPDSE
jgi:hypothetical protein